MLFRPRRDQRGPDRFLVAKMAILAIGGLVAITGFILRIDWLITLAIFILVVGLGLNASRFLPDRSSPANDDTSTEEPGP